MDQSKRFPKPRPAPKAGACRFVRPDSGFALVATLMLMVLLGLLAVGMISLSSVSLRSASQADAMSEARANARLALMIAIGELQKEMGPDMRVNAESALLDKDEKTEAIDDVKRSRWLASYDSWGNWLNASYTNPRTSANLTIQNTYQKGRRQMFRRWLLSLPPGQEIDIDAPVLATGMDDTNSVVLVGEGSLDASAGTNPDRVTRAYLVKVGDKGRQAWWIGPENHKARIDMANKPRTLAVSDWETSQGDTAEVGVGALDGFKFLDSAPDLSGRLVSHSSLEAAGASKDDTRNRFFDLTAHSRGVLASVRTGHLKKDLSLLFEKKGTDLSAPYKFNTADLREPSIRPMSPDLVAKSPKVPGRHFQSWTNMRHYYRMYRQISDATVRDYGNDLVATGGGLRLNGAGGTGSLLSGSDGPYTEVAATCNIGHPAPNTANASYARWPGHNNYWRFPVLAKITWIFSTMTTPASDGVPTKRDLKIVFTPVYTLWNPYNAPMRVSDNLMGLITTPYFTMPMGVLSYRNNVFFRDEGIMGGHLGGNSMTTMIRSGTGNEIILKPGEFRIFSHRSKFTSVTHSSAYEEFYPGYDPMAYGGTFLSVRTNVPSSERWGMSLRFSHPSYAFNINNGNTPGSLTQGISWTRAKETSNYSHPPILPMAYQNDWFNTAQQMQLITPDATGNPGNIAQWDMVSPVPSAPIPFAFVQLTMKGASSYNFESAPWAGDWRARNWLYGPAHYFGNGMYASETPQTLQTQRLENPFIMNFGPMSMAEMGKVVFQKGVQSYLGSGASPSEKVTQAAALELPSAPLSSLAGFSGMRINPGWSHAGKTNYPDLNIPDLAGVTLDAAKYQAETKVVAYQSGVTGPGIGNSFMHPVLPRNDVYRFLENSISMDPPVKGSWFTVQETKTNAFNDYWDHVFLLNDALWDDYFVSSLADQTRPGVTASKSLTENIQRLVADEQLPNSRYRHLATGQTSGQITTELQAADGYINAARHLMVDGMFNVNSTSIAAWQALFAGIRERQAVYRDANGALKPISVPSDKRIAITRFNTEVSDKEMADPKSGVTMPDGSSPGWSGVRFLGDAQLRKLAEECVKQVKRRGPFLNFSEFINRRLSNDDLGTMGALQSAIDYDDKSPEAASLNYRYKSSTGFMLNQSDLGTNNLGTPEAAVGSRFAGIPGYVIQSDILKPIANTLSVRDDTFRIRAYGESLDASGKVVARAWCEAIVQRTPEYCDTANSSDTPVREIGTNGSIADSGKLNAGNLRFGRRFQIESFRWLNDKEV